MNYLKRFACIFSFTGICATSYSQQVNLQGKVADENGSPALGAAVMLLNTDSSLVKGVATGPGGVFIIDQVLPNTYLLKVTYLGFSDYYKKLQLTSSVDLGLIKLRPSARQLKEVEVATTVAHATQNGDTTSYNSKAFKTNKDASAEDLVSKMPGVTVVDGKVQAQGEDVKQVLVDGQKFFGDDATSVLKNLPAEIIDKVQVFDKRSDQSLFSGMEDGNTSKTINIVTKTQFRNGTFGKAYAGYGYEDKYRSGVVLNHFKDKQRFTFLLMGNNVNEQNFSTEDLLGVTSSSGNNNQRQAGQAGSRGGGGSRSGGGGPQSDADNFLVNNKNGISATQAAGINYTDKWGKNVNVNASYFFNRVDNSSVSTLLRQYILSSSSGLTYNENNTANSINYNHRFNSRFEIRVDSFNSLILQPKLSAQLNDAKSTLTGINKNTEQIVSSTSNNFNSQLTGYSAALPFQFRHSFRKRGRTISLDATPSYNNSTGSNKLQTYNSYYTNSILIDTVDQRSTLDKPGFSETASLVYTEPLNKSNFLSLNYNSSYTRTQSAKNTYAYDPILDSYTIRDSLLTNVFNSNYISNAGGLSYRYQKDKINFSMGAVYQYAQLNKQQQFPTPFNSGKVFESVLPNAFLQYKFTPKKNLRLFYRSSTNAPTVDQLQTVLNNSNSLLLSTGNADLKQAFQHNLNIRYSSANTEKSRSLFFLLGGMYANNYIGNSTLIAPADTIVYNSIFLAKGTQLARPVNLDKYYNLRTFVNYSFSIKKIKSNMNISAFTTYNNIPALINNRVNYSNTTNAGVGVVLSSNISEKLDFNISSTPSYNYVNNTLQKTLNSTYYNILSKAKITYTPVKWLQVQAEYSNQQYSGLTGGYNQTISLLNGALAYKFLKNQQAELRLYVFDILNQNKSIQRTTTETYIEDARTNILQRYFMLTFTYNFKKFFEAKKEKKEQ